MPEARHDLVPAGGFVLRLLRAPGIRTAVGAVVGVKPVLSFLCEMTLFCCAR